MSGLPQVYDTPEISAKPHCGATVGLVFSDQDWMRNRKEAHKSSMLKKLENLCLICQTPAKHKSPLQILVCLHTYLAK